MTKKSDHLKISVIIPVFNSESTIGLLCQSLIKHYGSIYDLEIVLVNDASTDRTDTICRELHNSFPSAISYLRFARNFGEHNAIMAGLKYASGEICVLMDDDLQNPPEEVGKLLDEIQKGYDVVYACYNRKMDSRLRNLGSAFNDRVANRVLNKPRGLYLSSFKAINRFLTEEIVKYDGPDPYIDGIILKATSNIGSIAVAHRPRAHGKSGYSFGKLVALWGSMVTNYSVFPIRLVGIVGAGLVFYSLGYSLYKAYDDINLYGELSDFETLMSANLFFRGLALLAISIIGEYVGRIYKAIGRDPQYVIREILHKTKKTDRIEYIARLRNNDAGRSD